MRISGNQTAIAEILTLLDKNFKHPFECGCNYGRPSNDGTHFLTCGYRSKEHEQTWGCEHYIYDFNYDGNKISGLTLIHHGWQDGNILDGCVR